jgi:hypothetical protein
MSAKVISLKIPAGIQRDGTLFDASCYVDGSWMRFQRGRPRKMGGFKGIFQNATNISRGMILSSQNGLTYVYSGYNAGMQYWTTDNDDGVGAGPNPITMTSGFSTNATNLWQFDIGFNSGGSGADTIVAHPGVNLANIDNTVNTPVLYGTFPSGAMSPVGQFTAAVALVNGSPNGVITGLNALVYSGQLVTGTGIPVGTTLVSATVVGSNTNLVLSANYTGTTGTQTLTFDNQINVSGGCCIIYPYLFVYGNNGLIQNSSAGNFLNWVAPDANATNVATSKIVKGMPIRGGTTSPSGLFWSLDSLVRVSFAPQTVGSSTTYWRYDLISSQSSLLSSSSIIEYDGIYYWCGVDRFLIYNGVVQELKNDMCMNHFFDNLNYAQRQKVWASKVPRWGEIWWFYPRGDATECNDAVIYNVRDKVWYDVGEGLGARRSAGTFSEVFRFPIWAGNDLDSASNTILWQHETGVNQVNLTQETAIQSYFETNNLGWITGGPNQFPQTIQGNNNYIRLERIEPDFIQSGDMNCYVTGKGYAADNDVTSPAYVFSPNTLKIDLREQRREMRLRFESNVVNGNYVTGNILVSAEVGDVRSTGNP